MPPWHADDATHTKFANDRSLSESDRNVLLKWARGGAPEGNPKDLPPVPQFAEGWMMGKPDAVFTMQEDYPIPASGTLDYKFFEIPTNLTEDRWITAFEIRPGCSHQRPSRDRLRASGRHRTGPGRPAAPAGGARRHRRSHSISNMRRPADAPKPDHEAVANDRPAKRNPGGMARRVRAGLFAARLRAWHRDQDSQGRDHHRADALHDQRHSHDRSHEHRPEVRVARRRRRKSSSCRWHAELRAEGRHGRHARRRRDDASTPMSRCGAPSRTRTCAASAGKSSRSIPTAAAR